MQLLIMTNNKILRELDKFNLVAGSIRSAVFNKTIDSVRRRK